LYCTRIFISGKVSLTSDESNSSMRMALGIVPLNRDYGHTLVLVVIRQLLDPLLVHLRDGQWLQVKTTTRTGLDA
jgi:hypothetical protein